MVIPVKAIALALASCAFVAATAFAADPTDRTTMPEACTDRGVNCVIDDGAPRRRGQVAPTTPLPPSTSGVSGGSPDRRVLILDDKAKAPSGDTTRR